MNPGAACVLGVDVGRIRTRLALMDLQGRVMERAECETTRAGDSAVQCAWLAEVVSGFVSQYHGHIPPLAGAGIAAEGLVHLQNTSDRYTGRSEPARKRLETLLRVPVVEDTDCNFAALAEHWFGKAKGSQNAVVFNLTDGLGVGCFIEGRLLAGSRGWAGQVGHLPLGETGIPCFCGASSCLENVASGTGIIRMAKEAGLGGRNLSASHVAAMARDGSRPARKVFERFGKGLAKGIAVAIDFLNPESVILAGPVARNADLFMDTVREEVQKIAVPFMMEVTRVEVSELCEDGIILGTCIGILNQVYDSNHVTMRSLL